MSSSPYCAAASTADSPSLNEERLSGLDCAWRNTHDQCADREGRDEKAESGDDCDRAPVMRRYDDPTVRRNSKPLVFKNPAAEVGISRVEDALVTAEGDDENKTSDVFVYDSCLGSKRSLGRPHGTSLYSETLATAPGGRIFVADDLGILEFNIDGRSPSRVAGHPELPFAPEIPAPIVAGSAELNVSRPRYYWLMHADEQGDRLFSHSGRSGAHDHLVEIDLRQRAIVRTTPLRGFCAGIAISTKHSILVLPSFETGPEVQDLRGNIHARLSDALPPGPHPTNWFGHSAVRPTDGVVAISSGGHGIWLWDWQNNSAQQLTDEGAHPAWSPDGTTLFFMRTAAELWRMSAGGTLEPLVQAIADAGGSEEGQRKPGWGRSPRVSPDGRFVLALMTVIGAQASRHSSAAARK